MVARLTAVSSNSGRYFKRCSCSSSPKTGTTGATGRLSAGIVIIGDEVLRGDVRDANAYFLLKNLHRYGVSVRRIVFVGDEIDEIGSVVKEFAGKHNFVFTCGGVGPTHDDITYAAIAKAFDQQIVLRQDLWDLCKLYFGNDLTEDSPLTKFARIPERAESIIAQVVHNSRVFTSCLVRLDNIIILPGVPLITEKLFPVIVERLGLEEMPEITRELFLSLDEASITEQLNEAVSKFKDVKFGSYPHFHGDYYKTRLRIEASNPAHLDEVENYFRNSLPSGAIIDNFLSNPLEAAHRRIEILAAKHPFVREAYDVVCKALRLYKPEEICVAFSGGKDCTIVAYLYYAALQEHVKETDIKTKQNWLYVRSEDGRPEVEKFIEDSVTFYGAHLITINASYKEALKQAIDSGLKLFLLGNRTVDPKGDTLNHFNATDSDWPQAMRAFPILNWNYKEVWKFLRDLHIPYCPLYDQGFSSLGKQSTPNPKLIYVDERGVTRFRAAYLLDDNSAERIGRR